MCVRHHHDAPQPDERFYDVPEVCDGGPCDSASVALCVAVQHVSRRAVEQRQELDDLARAYQQLRARLDQAEDDDGLGQWRWALEG